MAANEKTGKTVGNLASKAMRTPEKMTRPEIRSLGASAITQRPDRPVSKASPPKRGR